MQRSAMLANNSLVWRGKLYVRRAYNAFSGLSLSVRLSLLVGTAVAVLCVQFIMEKIWELTYVWQMEYVGAVIRPVSRSSCAYEPPNTAGLAVSIGILLLYDAKLWSSEVSELSVRNKQQYAQLHGYEVVVANDLLDHSRPGAWSKLPAMLHHLPKFDYLVYMDIDTLVMNFDVRIEQFLIPGKDIIMGTDWSGPNTGVWIAKNTDWSKGLIKEVWDQKQFVKGKYPFEYEQRAFHYVLQTDVWRARNLPKYPNAEAIHSHFEFLPQCALNSYAVHPLYLKADRETSHYVRGDFIIHFAGKKGQVKVNLMQHYAAQAERNFRRARKAADTSKSIIDKPPHG
jgi:hypothetical protein